MTGGRRSTGLRRWHRWCGLGALVFLLTAAVTGSLLVYKKELVHLLVAPAATLPTGFDQAQLAAELDRIAAQVNTAELARIKAPNADEPYWTLTGADGGERLLAIGSLEPYTDHAWLLPSLAFVRELHTELLTGVFGEALLLASGAAGLFLCVAGLILWWPSRHSFRWRWVLPRPRPPKQLLVSHLHHGTVTAAVLILVTLTGSVMLWQKLVGPLLPPLAATTLAKQNQPVAAMAPSQWLQAAFTAVPDGWPTFIRLPDQRSNEFSVRFRLPDEWHSNGRTSVSFDTAGGGASLSQRSDQAPTAHRLLNQLYPLHTGYGLGGLYALLIFASGIALLWLSVTGFLSWLRRRRH